MSLLEDIFLQDEADEARELERVIEGDDIEERPRSPEDSDENSEKEDEAEEDKRRVDPTNTKATRVVKNPRFVLNPARLTGPRGIQVIPEHFKDFKFRGKGHEKDDLDFVLKKLEHWAYRLYPKFQFEDCLKKIETLGKKRTVMTHLHKIRSNQFQSDEIVVQKDSSDDEAPPVQEEDEFDKLLQQQIELARATPAPGSARKGFETPSLEKRTPFAMPKATSSPSINDEQRERMLRNRQLAEERRLARLKNSTTDVNSKDNSLKSVIIEENTNDINIDGVDVFKRHNETNVIDSSESDDEVTINAPITVDMHKDTGYNKENDKVDNTNGQNDIFSKGDIEKEVVTKRHHKFNVIDSSDSDEEMTIHEPITVDIHEDTGKYNKEHKINITNEERAIVNKRNNENDIINVTQNSNTKVVTEKRYNKSNVIDSSDSEEELTIHEPTIVDFHSDSGKKNKENIKTNKTNTTNEGNDIFEKGNNENDIVDITENVNKGVVIIKRHNKSNAIDSSDSDEEMTVNEPITVDIHDDDDNNYQDNDKSDHGNNHNINEENNENEIVDVTENTSDSRNVIKKIESPTINLTETDVRVKHNNFKENELIDITVNNSNGILSKDVNRNSNNIINIEQISHDIVTGNINTDEKEMKITPDSKSKEQNGINKSNVITEVEELMDFDFTDDF